MKRWKAKVMPSFADRHQFIIAKLHHPSTDCHVWHFWRSLIYQQIFTWVKHLLEIDTYLIYLLIPPYHIYHKFLFPFIFSHTLNLYCNVHNIVLTKGRYRHMMHSRHSRQYTQRDCVQMRLKTRTAVLRRLGSDKSRSSPGRRRMQGPRFFKNFTLIKLVDTVDTYLIQ